MQVASCFAACPTPFSFGPMVDLPPTPDASDAATRRAMQGNRRSDTAPEVALRSALHASGLRFRKDFPVVLGGLRVRPDVVFSRRAVAVFVDGCFWHGCPAHCRIPTRNREYWTAKIERNRLRDQRVGEALKGAGWQVVRVWEHEPVAGGVALVERALSGS